MLYVINGLMMTLSFAVVRCIFQTWLVFTKLVPSVFSRSEAMLAESSQIVHVTMWLSCCMYICLCAMNFFWFSKMVQGLLKFFSKKKDVKKE